MEAVQYAKSIKKTLFFVFPKNTIVFLRKIDYDFKVYST
ncbi:hypothetical protein Bsph_2018 [Lysinibacillus sphaericus C3-41]|uniref:Uncharacterized protein n=1 Tax=Lysinibacillus sphaericus (strain C3-41) TaxID=444177 RepID=B1HU40_LYSSC|nr:hypothetical protein Bsph_2018 [Lysinibacillus sphaericus C3-41]